MLAQVSSRVQRWCLRLWPFETVLLALVCDDTEEPNWLPIGVFEFQSEALPADWEFVLLDPLAASGVTRRTTE